MPPAPPSRSLRARTRGVPPVTWFEFSLLLWPSMCSSRPSCSSPTMRLSSRMAGQKRRLCPTASTTPARSQAPIIARASAARSASGFSQKTCLPARAAAMAWARCTECGVARTTACTEASSSASCRTLPEAMSTSRTKRIRSLLPCTDPTSARPQRPRPTMAASITNQGRSALLGLDAGLPDVPRPLRDLALDVRAELIRAQRRRVDAEGSEARLEIRLVHIRRDRVVDPADCRARRPRRGDQAVPQHDFVAGDLLADGRDVWRERRALRRGHAQGLQLAALDL